MLSTILISFAIFAVCAAITYRGIHNRRQGKSSCSCGGSCGSCGCSGLCHPQPKETAHSRKGA